MEVLERQVGQRVRLKDESKSAAAPGKVGKVVKVVRAVSGDGRREVQNCHVRFGDGDDATTEIHESTALVDHEDGEAPAPGKSKPKKGNK